MSDLTYFQVGGSLDYQHPTYVVRQADLDLYQSLKRGEFCYVLNARQMGKSSLRVQVMKKLKQEGVQCASIDLTRIGNHTTALEWYGGIVSELIRGFGLSSKLSFSNWWQQQDALSGMQRLSTFIEDVLLKEFSSNIVIFLDEIDSSLNLPFKDDFFALIRACYNQRSDNPDYKRLTFCLLGATTPSDLIQDKQRTPFNIGRAIELKGFQLTEAQESLTQGLRTTIHHPETMIAEVLAWTNGQPFLTQKVCCLIAEHGEKNTPNVSELVQTYIIDQWQTQDEPEHLRTIRDRLLKNKQSTVQLLELYRQILKNGGAIADDSSAQVALRLSGLVVKQGKRIQVHNRIYEAVFNQDWVEQELNPLKPYANEKKLETISPSFVFSTLQRFMLAEHWVYWAIWLGTAIAAGFASFILLDPILDSL
jgi:AAA-like domain